MTTVASLCCVRCGRRFRENELARQTGATWGSTVCEGCPKCALEGHRANLSVEIDLEPVRTAVGATGTLPVSPGPGLWRYGALLPVQGPYWTSLGEGNTPLIKLERFGKRIGLNELYVKDESRQPTWSYKDRLGALAVSKAREVGARVVTVASTGNHGAATAAYAARAGLPCVVFTTTSVPDVMKTLMQSFGAYVVALATPQERWRLMQVAVREHGWYPASGYVSPPIGSNPYGVDGYKTIAFEIFEQLARVPAWVTVPTCYGDGLFGVWKGWRELKDLGVIPECPRMIAAEAFGPLEQALGQGGHDATGALGPVAVEPTPAFSIATAMGTHQALAALRESGGLAVSAGGMDLLALQRLLARDEGLYAEASAIVGLAAVARLRKENRLSPDDTVVAILTSTGLKDPGATAAELPPVPVIEPDLRELAQALRKTYGAELL